MTYSTEGHWFISAYCPVSPSVNMAYGTLHKNTTWATLVGGKRSRHCTNPAPYIDKSRSAEKLPCVHLMLIEA